MMRKYVEFKHKWLGKRIDYDRTYGHQCVDLIKLYADQVLDMGTIGALGNAKEVHKNKLFRGWKILEGMGDVMQGDIIISTKGRYGHIAIVDRITQTQVFVLEQNGSGKNSGNGLGENAIRVKGYPLNFYSIILRSPKIEENFRQEVLYVERMIKRRTQAYDDALRLLNDTIEYSKVLRK